MSVTDVNPTTLPRRTVGEWAVRSDSDYAEPFIDIRVDAVFTGPDGRTFTVPAFFDGDRVWRFRFNPDMEGNWRYRVETVPDDASLMTQGAFVVTAVVPAATTSPGQRGFLQATPGQNWGFAYESGEPAFVFGDTTYNLFGMAHCGGDVAGFLARRAEQGFNLLRVRVPVSPFHPPNGYSEWQTRRTWAWGGSEQAARFDRFNLDYFATVDRVVQQAEGLGIGLEVIMEGWGFEYPFNARHIFTAEWEELWMRYLIARYDAYNCVYFWTPLNEYEYYPNGDWNYKKVADRWALRIARWIKQTAPHGHIVAMHNGPRLPPFAQRFAADPQAVDAIMYQEWGTRNVEQGWLAAGIEEMIQAALAGWQGGAVFAEWGYERNPEFPLLVPGHEFCDVSHTRRGAWRGAFQALGIIHGFDNSWGPFMKLEEDQPGIVDLMHVRRFFMEVVPFHRLQPAPELIVAGEFGTGERPSALATAERDVVAVYLPVGETVQLALASDREYGVHWFDPRTGELAAGEAAVDGVYRSPGGVDENDHPLDWVLLLEG